MYTEHTAPFPGGLLTDSGKIYVFDEAEETMVPFCIRAECEHEYDELWRPEDAECPAAYLGLKASAYAVYEGKLWYVVTNDYAWEFWTADLNNENHEKQFEIEMQRSGMIETSLFYQGCYYAPQMELFLDEESEKTEVRMRIVKVDLQDGRAEGVTDWGKDGEYLLLAGIYDGWVYYRYNERDESGRIHLRLYRVSQEDGSTELFLEAGEKYCVSMDRNRLVCGTNDAGHTRICCWDLDTGEKRQIFEEADLALAGVWASGGDVVWGRWYEDEEVYRYYIYDSASQEIRETQPYSEAHDRWTKLEDGWWCRAWKMIEEVGELATVDEINLFYYITVDELKAEKKMKRVQ